MLYVALVGGAHVADETTYTEFNHNTQAYPIYRHINENENIALLPLEEVEGFSSDLRQYNEYYNFPPSDLYA
jgi:hypothetical protein